jgi:hypothetical protein
VDKDLVRALNSIRQGTAAIRQQFPTLAADDVYAAVDFADGRSRQAAQMLDRLHRQRSRTPGAVPIHGNRRDGRR